MPATPPRYARVALPLGLRKTFTYSVPRDLREVLQVGHRVRVPLGRRAAFGYVVEFTSESPPAKLREIRAIEPEEVLFTPEVLRLTRWTADYYLSPWGQVLEAALPPSVRRAVRRRRGARSQGAGEGDAAAVAEWNEGAAGEPRVRLEEEQLAAVGSIREALVRDAYAAFLLLGVTGSGKTEVYLEAAEHVVAAGGNVLFLVPEIAMGTQILARVRARFGDRAGLFHSLTGDAERRRVWSEARDGRLPVVVGTRSAVFVPLPRLRLVVIDEEQEGAYKQDEAPRYHGRDVAVMRAQNAGAVVVLGSATPSLESLRNAQREKYRLLRLSRRVDGRPPARVVLVDLNEGRAPASGRGQEARGQAGSAPPDAAGSGGGSRRPRRERGPAPARPVLSPVLLRAVQEKLDRGEQTILFLNRRGHSPIVQCADCGESIQCSQCDVVMTFHKVDGLLRCHYCGAVRHGVDRCPSCQGPRFFYGGVGTQKVEEMLRETFPDARIARMDLDATRRKGSHARLVEGMERGEVDILLGTQMVAKGFHFPRVTLVGVLSADHEMLQPDFRASERAFQILTQVAGRAGRGTMPGEVVFQSLMPWHHVIACAAGEDYAGFAEREMQARAAFQYPPYHRIIDLLVDGTDEEKVRRRAESIRDLLAEFVAEQGLGAGRSSVEILGPAPMPHSRLKGRYRWHLTLKGPSVESLHRVTLAALEARAPHGLSGARIQVDVDPLRME